MRFKFFLKNPADRSGRRSAEDKEFQIAVDDWLKLQAARRLLGNLVTARTLCCVD